MNTVAIVQARSSSSRLPGKVLLPLQGDAMILFQLHRLSRCKLVDKLILATSNHKSDDELSDQVLQSGFSVYRGDLENVLLRFRDCAVKYKATTVVRLTGDCPFSDPCLVDELIKAFFTGSWDYLSNAADSDWLTVPDGFDVEVFKANLLNEAVRNAKLPSEREHVTSWMRRPDSSLRWSHHCHKPNRNFYRVTVDDPVDYEVVRTITDALYPKNPNFGVDDVVEFLDSHPETACRNIATIRNEGFLKSLSEDLKMKTNTAPANGRGPELWRRAKQIIPGGNMLLSKRSEMFLPEKWPSYFSRAKGCFVWDLDDRKLIDMSIMGIGTNILGYGNPEVDSAVSATVAAGNMSTLNCPEEVWLAEKLVELHPWSEMVRFARSGGEANAIAIRIARAATGRDSVAICGYHGWHDWYLASNLQTNSRLEEHLLPGLEPNGVPSCLSGTVHPFSYNRLDQLESIASNYNLAAVKMEVQRSIPPEPGFLESVRSLCSQLGIVLIFDECSSGFREALGGLHLKYGINPDMAMFGKTLGNGYAITSVIGKREIMDAAQSTFISSTFWTERIGPSAALKTLEVMKEQESWAYVTDLGNKIRSDILSIANRYRLNITFAGLPSLTSFSFNSPNDLAYKTLLTQEMLKKGYLASTSIYISTAHNQSIVDNYLNSLDDIFALISKCEDGILLPDNLLEGPICTSGFTRLN